MKFLLLSLFILLGVIVTGSVYAQEESSLPDWVRNIFIWYANDEVSEEDLLNAIGHLISIDVIPGISCDENTTELIDMKCVSTIICGEDTVLQDNVCTVSKESAEIIHETRYVSFEEDSPFYELSNNNSYFYREDFEDGSLNVPGVVFSDGDVFGPSDKVDSVDKDDGKVDGKCPGCYSYQVDKETGFFFITFDKSKLKELPTHAGIVVTDSTWDKDCSTEPQILVNAIDSEGNVVDSKLYENIDFGDTATTVNDVFFGAIHEDGIKQMQILIDCGSMEVDHLQYGRQ